MHLSSMTAPLSGVFEPLLPTSPLKRFRLEHIGIYILQGLLLSHSSSRRSDLPIPSYP